MKFIPSGMATRDLYRLLSASIVPRPIAFVTTVNKNGLPNAAPFCFFMGVTPSPPTIAISIMRRGDGGDKKDTIRNIEATRDFVVNVVDEALASAMNMASGSYPSDMSEFDVTGLTPVPSEYVSAPRIGESPIHMECKLRSILDLGDVPAALVIAEVVCFHVKDSVMVDGHIDPEKLKAIGRVGDTTYTKISNLFEMNRPA
jgi:flavin reductase (DIM6/NTAB) family NADH-FMN oxidoreductase RutF